MKRKNAFTLVELLVVIGIISLLISMLLPALNQARDAAKKISCASNMRQIFMAIRMYGNDNNGWMPPNWSILGVKVKYALGNYTPEDYMLSLLLPIQWNNASVPLSTPGYLPNADVLYCPADTWHIENRPSLTSNGVTYKGLSIAYPGAPSGLTVTSYMYLFFPPGPGNGWGGRYWTRYRFGEQDYHDRRTSSQTAILYDSTWPGIASAGWNVPYMNHKDGINVLYMDGHVKFLRTTPEMKAMTAWPAPFDYLDLK